MDLENNPSLLEMIERPAFCVRDGVIVHANKSAMHQLFTVGERIADFLPTDAYAYEEFHGGCLYLNVTSANVTSGASVTRIDDFDLFLLDTEGPKLEAFALAAQQLKKPLSTVVNVLEQLIVGDAQYEAKAGYLRQSVYQLSRTINNMADTSWYRADTNAHMQTTEFAVFFWEMMDKLESLTTDAGHQLQFTRLTEPVVGMADRQMLTRAVSNMLSNAIKFSPKGSLIEASLSRKGNFLYFSMLDPGDMPEARCNVFTRYLRAPIIEDSRNGIGLGMAIVHAVATAHGGTVLVDSPDGEKTRVTLSIAIRNSDADYVRSPVLLPQCEYTGGFDPGLIELSEVLPPSCYKNIKN